MDVCFSEQELEELTAQELKTLQLLKKDTRRYSTSFELFELTKEQFEVVSNCVDRLVVSSNHKSKETKQHIREMEATVKRAREVLGDKDPKAANCKSAVEVIKVYLAKRANQFRLYKQSQGQWFGFFVEDIRYYEQCDRNSEPAHTVVRLGYYQWGKTYHDKFTFYHSDCRGKTAMQILASAELYVETPEIRAQYDESLEVYTKVMLGVGVHYLIQLVLF